MQFNWNVKATNGSYGTGIADVPVSAGIGSNNISFDVLLMPGYKMTSEQVTVSAENASSGSSFTSTTDYEVTVTQKTDTDLYTVTLVVKNPEIANAELTITPAEDNNVSGWEFHPSRIWNCFAEDPETGKATGDQINDAGTFSKMYKAGTYTVEQSQLTRDADGNYAMKVTVSAEEVVPHYNPAKMKSWWTGWAAKVPTGVGYVKGTSTVNGVEREFAQGVGTVAGTEDANGTYGDAISHGIRQYVGTSKSMTLVYDLGCYANAEATEALYKITITVDYNLTLSEKTLSEVLAEEAEGSNI